MPWLVTTPDGALARLKIVPRASRNEVKEIVGDALKIRLQAPPVEGKANAALVRFLAGALDVSAGSIRIVAGETSRLKQVLIRGMSAAEVEARLAGK